MLRVGILGCGGIAAKIADALKGNKKVVIAATTYCSKPNPLLRS